MRRRYASYAAVSVGVLVFLAQTSYGVLLMASIAGILVLAFCVSLLIGVLSLSDRVGHQALRVWRATVPQRVLSLISRQ